VDDKAEDDVVAGEAAVVLVTGNDACVDAELGFDEEDEDCVDVGVREELWEDDDVCWPEDRESRTEEARDIELL
jgi:hypothetical protein